MTKEGITLLKKRRDNDPIVLYRYTDNPSVVTVKSTKVLYSNAKYQYDIFGVIHNSVNLHLMLNRTSSKTSK